MPSAPRGNMFTNPLKGDAQLKKGVPSRGCYCVLKVPVTPRRVGLSLRPLFKDHGLTASSTQGWNKLTWLVSTFMIRTIEQRTNENSGEGTLQTVHG